jgi:hypothetical protein
MGSAPLRLSLEQLHALDVWMIELNALALISGPATTRHGVCV